MFASMMEIYGLTVVASVLLAMGLSLLGTQLAAKDRAMQTLCMGQGAMLGVLLGLGLAQSFFSDTRGESLLPLALALVSAALSFFISEYLVSKRLASSNTHFVSFFAILLSGAYLLSALFPALENHMAQKYFGDLATVSSGESLVAGAAGLLLMVVFTFRGRQFTEQSFEASIAGRTRQNHLPTLLDILSILAICTSVQTVGYLFTIACLFIPTAFASRTLGAGLKKHFVYCVVLAAITTLSGFVLSLLESKLPTVPTIIGVMLVGGILSLGVSGVWPRRAAG